MGELSDSPQVILTEEQLKVGNPFRKLMKMKLELSCEVTLCWVLFVVLEGAIQTVRSYPIVNSMSHKLTCMAQLLLQ